MKLYDISAEIASILNEEEWTEETEQQLEALNLSLEVKAKNIVEFMADIDGFVDAAKKEEKRIAERRKAAENRRDRLKEYLHKSLEAIDRTELEAGSHKLKIQNNPPKVVIDEESEIPPKYFVVIPETFSLDKKTLAEDLKKGPVKGAHLERGTSLRIR